MVVLVAEIPLISKVPVLVRSEEGAIDPAPLKARVPPEITVGPVYVLAADKVNIEAADLVNWPGPENTPDAVPGEF